MTQDEIIEMAKEARIHRDDSWRFEMLQEKNALEVFAKLVAEKATAAEREACAKVCEEVLEQYRGTAMGKHAELVGDDCADAIRARGQA
jgi:hypothetical protein